VNGRIGLAALLACGFVGLIALAMFAEIREGSQRIVDGSLGALGAALVNAIAGIFRTDQADEQRAKNTARAFDSIDAAINATPSSASATGKPDDPVNVVEKPE
jgi:hypothetical protein